MSSKVATPKRRNNEKRKERSRVAAKCRRSKEHQIFEDLTAALPAKKEEVEQLDKASVMRLAISYLKVRKVVRLLPELRGLEPKVQVKEQPDLPEVSYLKALDGFVLVISQLGDIVYCSENIAEHLGVTQMEIMGQNITEFSHPCEHEEIREALRGTGKRELLVRLKCTLTGKGRSLHLKSAAYKVVHLNGHMLNQTPPKDSEKDPELNNNVEEEHKVVGAFIAVGRPIPHPSNIEVLLDNKTFLSKHGLDMKFTYTDDALKNTLGFAAGELVGKSLYEYHHAGDSAALATNFKSLFSKGQCETGQYRFLAKDGGYAWVQTQATVITDKNQRPISVVCVNYVISGIECKDEVFASHQLREAELKSAQVPVVPQISAAAEPPANGAIVAIVTPEEARPRPTTAHIFAPRTEEMNTGYLTFSEEDSGLTMLKDEPDDLTHLAPTAGDACIPLVDNPFDMFDFNLDDNYCSLLGDDLDSASPGDSFSDPLTLSSPETQESDSSCEQSSYLTELLDIHREGELEDRAPYIPMSGSDELPSIAPAVMWGALPENVSLARPLPPEPVPSAPALQRLLAAPPTGPPPQDIISNIYTDPGLMPSGAVSHWNTGLKRTSRIEEEPNPKRIKRSPSPCPRPPQSSSVLMNLLQIQQQKKDDPATKHPMINSTSTLFNPISNNNYPSTPNLTSQLKNVRVITPQATRPLITENDQTRIQFYQPLTLNITPTYNLSPNLSPFSSSSLSPGINVSFSSLSPNSVDGTMYGNITNYNTINAFSPIQKYNQTFSQKPANAGVSPGSILQSGLDPFLSNNDKTQLSLGFAGFQMASPIGFSEERHDCKVSDVNWMDTNDLLGTGTFLGFDDIKMLG